MSPQPILVDCKQFGERQVDCRRSPTSTDESLRLRNLIAANWDAYWSLLYEATSEMGEQVHGIYDFDASFESHNFRIQIYHYDFSRGVEQVMFRIEFLDADSQEICPVFDTTFEGLEVVHSQPCF